MRQKTMRFGSLEWSCELCQAKVCCDWMTKHRNDESRNETLIQPSPVHHLSSTHLRRMPRHCAFDDWRLFHRCCARLLEI